MKIQEDKIRKDKIHLNIRVTLFVEKIKKKKGKLNEDLN